tara:strand:+ start:672 stop:1079 length:408 start_codon:yes stop_codon:yes gene_type:complete
MELHTKKRRIRKKPKGFAITAKILGVKNLSKIAEKLGISLKSLEKENPHIKDLNKIGENQRIKLPIRKKSFVEKYILGKRTAPPSVKIKNTPKNVGYKTKKGVTTEDVTYKKDSQGTVYKGMTESEMKKLQKKKK